MLNDPVNLIDPYGLFDIALTPLAIAAAPAIAMIDSPVLPFADAAAGALIGLAWMHDNWTDDYDKLHPPADEMAKGGKQNVRDTGLADIPDDEISRRARDRSLPPEERRRYQKEEKGRKMRNKDKRCGQ